MDSAANTSTHQRRTCRLIPVRLLLPFPFIISNAALVHAQATFTPLGFFGGAAESQAHDVSADGSVVVGRATNFPDQSHVIFRWTRDESIVYKELTRGTVAVSDDGTTIVGSRYLPQTNLDEAFRWIPNQNLFEGLGDFAGGAFQSSANDVSADGTVIVGNGNMNNQTRAFRWTEAGGMIDIGPGAALGVSSGGNVIVGSTGSAFRWTAETGMVALPSLPGSIGSSASGVSPDGSVAVGAHDFRVTLSVFAPRATRWTEQDGAIAIGRGNTFANDVSDDGLVAVGSGIGRSTGSTAFYWTPQIGFAELQDVLIFGGATGLDGWRLISATGISHDGRTVVGSGFDPNRRLQAFVATIGAVPEPSTFALGGLAATALIGLLIRRSMRLAARIHS